MSILPESTKNIVLPKMYKIEQIFPNKKIDDVYAGAYNEIANKNIDKLITEGESVAILVGSRGISGLKEVVKATVDQLIRIGAKPFIVPAMGSHGGGVAKEQRAIVENFGVTEEFLGIPIKSAMDTIIIGKTDQGVAIHIDKIASEADHIVPIVRVKQHTDFDGPIESGLCKMLSIGLGKHNGCATLHKEGFVNFNKLIPEVGDFVIKNRSIPFGMAIVENAHENVHTVKLVYGNEILQEEPKLLELSKSLMPRLYFDHIDVLIVEQIGKDITGAGMDPNITGRSSLGRSEYFTGPTITRIVALGLSEGTHNNANGVGYADFITKALYEDIDFVSTYTNGIAAGSPTACNIPVFLDTEKEAILAALQTCPRVEPSDAKIVRIKDTLHLVEIEVSESLYKQCKLDDRFKIS
jgi:hypothetical protein